MNETELLFTEVLGCSRAELYLEKKKILSRQNSLRVSSVLKRRISGEPIQYILGKTEFMGLEFKVNPAVLIPRPDTEILVEAALRHAGHKVSRQKPLFANLNILDIGTGSGCIAVSIAKYFPQAKVSAVDISLPALEIAAQNAELNLVRDRIDFINCDLFPPHEQPTSYELRAPTYDLVVSNPPYIKTNIIDTLETELQYEPRKALDGGEDGLSFYRRIIREIPFYLKPDGLLILEIGFDQKKSLEKILGAAQIFEVKEIIKDYNSIERVVVAQMITDV